MYLKQYTYSIQCLPKSKKSIHRNRTISTEQNRTISNRTKISMEPQKILYSNSEGEKKNKFGGITLFQSHRNQNSMVLPEKQIHISMGQN